MTNRYKLFAICLVATMPLAGCGSDSEPEVTASPDSGQTDTGTNDGGTEAGTEAGIEAGADTQTPDAEEETGSDSGGPEGGLMTGTLTVRVNHADGGFTVSDGALVIANKAASDCPLSSGYFICDFELQTGPYLVEFKDVPDFTTPADAAVALTQAGATVDRIYVIPGNNGTLTVGVDIAEGGFVVKDFDSTVVADHTDTQGCPLSNGYYTCQMSLPSGIYTIEFAAVTGYTEPPDVDVVLDTSGAEIYRDYTPL